MPTQCNLASDQTKTREVIPPLFGTSRHLHVSVCALLRYQVCRGIDKHLLEIHPFYVDMLEFHCAILNKDMEPRTRIWFVKEFSSFTHIFLKYSMQQVNGLRRKKGTMRYKASYPARISHSKGIKRGKKHLEVIASRPFKRRLLLINGG